MPLRELLLPKRNVDDRIVNAFFDINRFDDNYYIKRGEKYLPARPIGVSAFGMRRKGFVTMEFTDENGENDHAAFYVEDVIEWSIAAKRIGCEKKLCELTGWVATNAFRVVDEGSYTGFECCEESGPESSDSPFRE